MSLVLEARDIQLTYPGPKPLEVLRGIDLKLMPSDIVAVMGPSGCGKSSLVACLAGLLRPTSGVVTLLGVDLWSMSLDHLTQFRAKNLGIIFQQFHLMPQLTAVENVALPLELQGATHKKALAAAQIVLEKVNLSQRAHHFPHQLSRGECQRVAIARVLVHKPKIIFADEPTASLDRSSALECMQLLVDQARATSAALLVVTHDPEMSRLCTKQFYFLDGKLHSP